MTPEQFFTKNMKWIALALLFLFLLKTMQSCNRNMSITIIENKHAVVVDSLENVIDSIKTDYLFLKREYELASEKFNFELRLEQSKADAANQRANAVQSAVEKLKTNTTITVKGAEEIRDTIKKK